MTTMLGLTVLTLALSISEAAVGAEAPAPAIEAGPAVDAPSADADPPAPGDQAVDAEQVDDVQPAPAEEPAPAHAATEAEDGSALTAGIGVGVGALLGGLVFGIAPLVLFGTVMAASLNAVELPPEIGWPLGAAFGISLATFPLVATPVGALIGALLTDALDRGFLPALAALATAAGGGVASGCGAVLVALPCAAICWYGIDPICGVVALGGCAAIVGAVGIALTSAGAAGIITFLGDAPAVEPEPEARLAPTREAGALAMAY